MIGFRADATGPRISWQFLLSLSRGLGWRIVGRCKRGTRSMNKKQKIVLWSCIFAIAVVLIFPPWNFVHRKYPHGPLYSDAGYSFIFVPPSVPVTSRSSDGREEYYLRQYRTDWNAEINYSRLIIPIAIVLLIGGGLIVSFRSNSQQEHRTKGATTTA